MAYALLLSTLAAPAPRHQPSAVEAAGINQWMSNILNPWGAGMWEAYGGPYWAAAGMSNVPYGVWAQGFKPQNKGGMTAEAAAKMHSLERQQLKCAAQVRPQHWAALWARRAVALHSGGTQA